MVCQKKNELLCDNGKLRQVDLLLEFLIDLQEFPFFFEK